MRMIFDTNIFDRIVDNNIDISLLNNKHDFFVTHIQKNELEKTGDQERKSRLLERFSSLEQKTVPTESFILGTSELNGAKLGDGIIYDKLLMQLNGFEKKENNHKDALIGETAIMNNLILVSDDNPLLFAASKFGCAVMNFKAFIEVIKNEN